MKKKRDNLFEKLRFENAKNSASQNALNDIEVLIKYLPSQSLLQEKIAEIRILQVQNNVNSANEINKILNEEFEYSYPFYFELEKEFDIQIPVLKKKLFTSTLIEHIKTENYYINKKNAFNKAIRLNQTNKELQSKINTGTAFGGCILPAAGFIIVVLFLTNLISGFWDNAEEIQKVTAYGIICVIIFTIGMIIYSLTSNNQIKNTINQNKKLIESIIIELTN